ncbi:MAG: LysR family transcriptional regulator [Chthoniobacter sp.]|nr:LysR family transcriptional regulator [Chthoniobacter sp.]
MSLRAVNLNLLPVLQVLLRERNLTRAGNLLGLTQSALSMALSRLRQILEDPLLVRSGRQMVLTVKAQELIPAVEEICARIEGIFPHTGFNPLEDRGKVVIASSDYGFQLIAAKLMAAMEKVAPYAMLHLVDVPHTTLEPHAGEVDFFILPKHVMVSERFSNMRYEKFLNDSFVTIVSKETALRCHAGHAPERFAVYYPGLVAVDPSALSVLNGWDGITGQVVAQVQHFNLLPAMVLEGSCAAVVPRKLAAHLQEAYPIEILENLGTTNVEMEMAVAWYASQTTQPRNRWFRTLILELGRT